MNLAILHPDVQDFISDNLTTEITKLILKGSPFAAISIQELANQIVAKQKSKKNYPLGLQHKTSTILPKLVSSKLPQKLQRTTS